MVSSVIRLRSQRLSEIPILVLVDLQQEYVAAPRITALPGAHAALRKCRDALAAARASGIPIAFTRLQGASGFFNRSSALFDWVEGFEPLRSEMVFDRDLPSCYSSEGFAAFMKDVSAPVVLAGFSGESACLATLVEGYHRKQQMVYLADASASQPLNGLDADEVQRAIAGIASVYADIVDTDSWTNSLAGPRQFTRANHES
jgi:nicotinamidase-related amidase